jgi:hypothetical protein
MTIGRNAVLRRKVPAGLPSGVVYVVSTAISLISAGGVSLHFLH